MTNSDVKQHWDVSLRALAGVAGLDAEAEWLLGTQEYPGEAIKLFLARSLTKKFDPRIPYDPGGYENQRSQNRKDAEDEPKPPFSMVISPKPGGGNGPDILELLLTIAAEVEEELKGAHRQPLFLMTDDDKARLAAGGIAGALCNDVYFQAAIQNARFRAMEKVIRLSTALRERAVPEGVNTTWTVPDWLKETLQQAHATSPKLGAPPVVVGVIDDSFAIGHPRFQFSDGQSRIFSYWDQDADYDPNDPTVDFGRELLSVNPHMFDEAWPDKVSLNASLAQAAADKLPGPDFYRQRDMQPFYPSDPVEALRLASHGTHVMDLAAGANRRKIDGFPCEQVADEAPILIAVKLPRASVQDTSGAFLEFYLLEGVQHIHARAKMVHPDAKVVIVSSYGFYGGPHDGASQIERAMDNVIAAAPGDAEIVLPSGNGRRERSHTRRSFETRPVQEISWRVAPDDGTPSVMEVWSEPYPVGTDAMMELSIVTPDGLDSRVSGHVLMDVQTDGQLVLIENGHFIVQAVCVHPAMHPKRRLFLIWMQPTALNGPGIVGTPAASGVWTVRLRALDQVYARPASIWIRRDDSLVGFPSGGRQSAIERDWTVWKDDPKNSQEKREDVGDVGTAQRSRTINKIATGSRTVVVGGFDVDLGERFPVPSSAGGPTAQRPDHTWTERLGPDALAPSQIFGGLGVAAAGFFGGGKVRFRGTSVAAPLVSAEIATAIVNAGYPGGRDYVQGQAQLSEAKQPSVSEPSDALGGSGRYVTARMRSRGMAFEGT